MESTPKKRGRFVALGFLTVVGLAVGGTCVNSDVFRAYRDLNPQLDKAKAEGLVVDLREYQPPVVADADNAASAYRLAVQEVQGECKEAFQTIQKNRKSVSVDDVELNKALDQAQPTLNRVIEASKLPAADFGRQWTDGLSLMFPEYGPLRLVGDGLRLDAMRRLGRGDVIGAVERAGAIGRMGNHIGQEPTIISSLVRAGSVDQAFQVLSEVIRLHGKDAKVRAAVREAVSGFGEPPSVREATRLELAWQLQAIDSLATSTDWVTEAGNTQTPVSAKLGRIGIVRKAFQARTVEYWRGFYEAVPEDPNDYIGAFKGIQEHEHEYDTAHAHEGHDHKSRSGLSYSMLQYLRPVFSGASIAMARQEAKKRLLIGSLDAIEGKLVMPTDPFSGKPLRLKNGVLYSVAENGKDDGGSSEKEKGKSFPLDFVQKLP